jgi:hypothetical protein
VLGPECLVAAIGPDPSLPEIPERDPARPARAAAAAAFAVAVVASALPWSRFGAGSEAFGAWSDTPAWSMVAAVAAVIGLLIAVVGSFARRGRANWDVLSALVGGVVAAACVLALLRPRPFTSPWLGPWIALGSSVAAVTASIAGRGRARERDRAHI